MADRVGQQLGNYRLSRLLGKGGFAEVYLGEHVYLKTPAAIKLLQSKVAHAADLEDFLTEAQIIAQLVHPHIVRVLEFGLDGETPFLVMDYAPNGTLRQRHPKGSRLPLTKIIPYVQQIAEALHYAHEEKFIHRDVKPENMLVGRRDTILLSDFGIALIAQSSRYQSTQEVIGTVAYMSPEQIRGKPRPASDQYSLAVVVYEWLSGERPFHGSFTELCTQHMFASPPPLGDKGIDIPSEVEAVVMTALAKDPHQRFGSVQAFATALEKANQTAPSRPIAPPSELTSSSLPVPPTDAITAFSSRQLSGLPNAAASFPPPAEILSDPSSAKPFSVANLSTSENTFPLLKTRRNSALASNRQDFRISRTVLLIGLALLVIASGTGLFAVIHANQLATFNAASTATAQANTHAATSIKTASPTPVPSPTTSATNTDPYPPGTWKLALNDPLSQPSYWNNGSNPSFGGSCQFSNGAYHIKQSKRGNFFCAPPTNFFSNLTVEVKMTIIMGDCGGIFLRGNGPAYFFAVCQNGQYGLYLYRSPAEQTLVANSSAAIHTGPNQSNMIAVVANGSNFDLYVNYQKINSASDSFVSSGEINFSAEDLSNSTEVVYSDARVWTP